MSKIDEKLPGDWTSVDATEIFALLILFSMLILVGIRGIGILEETIMKEIIAVCLLVLFGSKYVRMRSKRQK